MRSRPDYGSASPVAATTPGVPVQMSLTRPERPPPSRAMVWVALGTVYVIWGSTYLGMRVVAASLPAFGSAAIRYGIAGVLLASIIVVVRGWAALRVTGRQLISTAIVGVLLLVGGNGLIMLAESPSFALPSGIAALLVALNPLLMVGLRAATGDRPRPTTVIGAVVGLGGLVLLFLPGLRLSGLGIGHSGASDPVPTAGALLVLAAVLSWSGGSFATRWLPMPSDPFVASVYEMLLGATAMGLIAAGRGESPIWAIGNVPMRAWLALAYLIIAGSLIAFTAYIWLLHHAPISLASTYAYVNPVIALILGAVLLGESLPGQIMLAAGTVIVGVALVVSTEKVRAPATESGPDHISRS